MQDPTPLEGRRRRLLFRANHRGTRENDILIGGFVATRLAAFSQEEIAVLEVIMELPDTWLADWLTGRTAIPAEHDTPMLRAMREARGQGPDLSEKPGQGPDLSEKPGQGPDLSEKPGQGPDASEKSGQAPTAPAPGPQA